MSDSQPKPDEDVAPVDPFEAELIAYLDGELEPAAAQRIEARLAADPQARARAAALKKTFDLLDYLPKPEPSPNFTHRTLDRLPTIQIPPQQRPQPAKVAPPAQFPQSQQPGRVSQPAAAVLPSQAPAPSPVARPSERPTQPPRWGSPRQWVMAAGILAAAACCAVGGFLGAKLVRPTQQTATKEPEDHPPEPRLVEMLPLYAPADNLEFVQELATPGYFGDDPAVTYDPALKVPPVQFEKPASQTFEALEKAFKSLPPERQQAIRTLDQQLFAEKPADRDRLIRVLEAYVVWLGNLSEADRKAISGAPTLIKRLNLIREVRAQQWIDSLPQHQRNQLVGLSANQKSERIKQWKEDEFRRREEWARIRKHADSFAPNKAPFPFETELRRKAVMDFARAAFRLEELKDGKSWTSNRLTANELEQYNKALQFATTNGGMAWWVYGKTVYDLSEQYKTYLLPLPEDPTKRYVEISQLLAPYKGHFTRDDARKKLAPYIGKWPEFPLEVHRESLNWTKGSKAHPYPLGPAKETEFQQAVRNFARDELFPKLKPEEKVWLRQAEGKWPEYSQQFMLMARRKDLSVPGVTLPFEPSVWERVYGERPGLSKP